MTLAAPGATGFVALAQRAVIGIEDVFCRPLAVSEAERPAGTRGGGSEPAQAWFSSFRSGIGNPILRTA